jgi:hypothetical protein
MVRGELPITEKLPERLRWTQLVNIAAETGVLLNCKLMKKLNAVKTMRTAKLLSIALTLLCFAAQPSIAASERPNIVIILTDDQGYADISFNPNHSKEVSTPHMDALAKEGVFFS